MEPRRNNIHILDIRMLLDGSAEYLIPVYQRNYAWKEEQISQLIQDVIDYVPLKDEGRDYYIGTLVTYERNDNLHTFYETIDGQQRVTTLTLLLSAIKHDYPEIDLSWYQGVNIEFESRKSSSETLARLYDSGSIFSSSLNLNQSLINGYELCSKILKKKLNENGLNIKSFAGYLLERVKILRVTVPGDTDLNHYFEIMNNRGEQLEKHEILKSRFLEILNNSDDEKNVLYQHVFNLVWEACSDMERYLQYGFTVEQRDIVFGKEDWNTLQPTSFSELTESLKNNPENSDEDSEERHVTEIIKTLKSKEYEDKIEETFDRFNTVINFPNFLLQVLRVYTRKDIPLDDKRLINIFDEEIKTTADKFKFACGFGFELLRCKFFFDKYIIKREFISGIDKWSLKRLKWYKGNKVGYVNTFEAEDGADEDKNRTILMLLAMFHVSTPTQVYKHWLNAALYFLAQKNDIVAYDEYKNHLLATVRSFVFDRFLSKDNPKEYYDIIYKSTGRIERKITQLNISKLTFEENIDNIIFNYLDYLLWEKYKDKNNAIRNFEYSFRSSVEHYFPRNPMPGFKKLDEKDLNSFGNLCLISHSKNSSLSNYSPVAKKEHYQKQEIDSIKQWIMMNEYEPLNWDEKSIADHRQKMIEILTEDLNSDYEDLSQPQTDGETKALNWFNKYKGDAEKRKFLIRALFCFDDFCREVNSKWFFYDWDSIRTDESFKYFLDYCRENNPESLEDIIEDKLKNDKELRDDDFRYVVVKYPEILDYCADGYFSWIKDGEQVILHEGKRDTESSSTDMMIHLLFTWLKKLYKSDNSIYHHKEYFGVFIDYNPQEERFVFGSEDSYKGECFVELMEEHLIECYIQPRRNASNNSFVQGLIQYGWSILEGNYYKWGKSAVIGKLTEDYDENFRSISGKLQKLLKNGLGISPEK